MNVDAQATLPPPSARPEHERYVTLDAWRGVACLGVVLFHSFGSVTHDVLPAVLEPIRHVARYGWLGLHAFFVLSGYCIFERVRLALRTGETAPEFLLDRARRVFPPYWVALFASIAMNLAASPLNGTTIVHNLPDSAWSWFNNLALTHALAGQGAYILVTWTLACECVFYLLSGLLLLAAGRGGQPKFAVIAGALLCLAPLVLPSASWTLPLMLWPDFFLGLGVSVALAARRKSAFALLAVLTAAALVDAGAHGINLSRGFAAGFAWLLFGLHPADRWLARVPVIRLLGGVGVFSYSLYLMHVQFASRILNLGRRFVEPSSPAFIGLWATAVAGAIAGSWLFWRMIEQPIEQWRGQQRKRRASSIARAGAIPAASSLSQVSP